MQTKIKKEQVEKWKKELVTEDVTYFIADDGKEFKNEYDAKKHNEVLAAKAKELTELKPCPFCGCKEVDYEQESDSYSDWAEYKIVCQGCNGQNSSSSKDEELGRLEAKEAWNRRVEK
mgnify:CR=1 FL=1